MSGSQGKVAIPERYSRSMYMQVITSVLTSRPEKMKVNRNVYQQTGGYTDIVNP